MFYCEGGEINLSVYIAVYISIINNLKIKQNERNQIFCEVS